MHPVYKSCDPVSTNQIAVIYHCRLNSDCNEMEHAAHGLDFLWHHLPPEKLLHEESDVANLSFRCALSQSGITPCLLVNLGSALTIEQVSACLLVNLGSALTIEQVSACLLVNLGSALTIEQVSAAYFFRNNINNSTNVKRYFTICNPL